jgi:hypothetical protein
VAAGGKHAGALASGLPRCNGWTIAAHAGDRTPDKTQRLLSRASWDTLAAMGEVRRFAVAVVTQSGYPASTQLGPVIPRKGTIQMEYPSRRRSGTNLLRYWSRRPTPGPLLQAGRDLQEEIEVFTKTPLQSLPA